MFGLADRTRVSSERLNGYRVKNYFSWRLIFSWLYVKNDDNANERTVISLSRGKLEELLNEMFSSSVLYRFSFVWRSFNPLISTADFCDINDNVKRTSRS